MRSLGMASGYPDQAEAARILQFPFGFRMMKCRSNACDMVECARAPIATCRAEWELLVATIRFGAAGQSSESVLDRISQHGPWLADARRGEEL